MTASLEERYALGLKSAPKADAPQALTGRSSSPTGTLLKDEGCSIDIF